jgi:hypothetical protein
VTTVQASDGLGQFRPVGESTLVEAVDRIAAAIAACRERELSQLLVNATGLVGVHIPTLVDRFLMVEEWAARSGGRVAVALVVHAEYIHPRRFGVKAAAEFGLLMNVHTSDVEALDWLRSLDRN